jgi:hypothetical protein
MNIDDFRHLEDEQWAELIVRSLENPKVQDLEFPKFPNVEIQSQFVGSSNEHAIREALVFYKHAKKIAKEHGFVVNENSCAIDFGTGWGRFTRFLWKDFAEKNITALDTDREMIELCRSYGLPGNLEHIAPIGKLPNKTDSVDFVVAYSVFTHLPLEIHKHWSEEFKRAVKRGGIVAITVEPRRFLEFVRGLKWKPFKSDWQKGLAKFNRLAKSKLEEFDKTGFAYLPTGGGGVRTSEVYGDAVCSKAFLEKIWGPEFEIISIVDDPKLFWQSPVVFIRT